MNKNLFRILDLMHKKLCNGEEYMPDSIMILCNNDPSQEDYNPFTLYYMMITEPIPMD